MQRVVLFDWQGCATLVLFFAGGDMPEGAFFLLFKAKEICNRYKVECLLLNKVINAGICETIAWYQCVRIVYVVYALIV